MAENFPSPPNTELLTAALRTAARGWPVFPLRPYSKVPAVRGWEQRASADPQRLQAWWSTSPEANIGLACGPAHMVVIDFDSAGHGAGAAHARDRLTDIVGDSAVQLWETYAVATPSGEHLYFAAPPQLHLRNTAGLLGAHIDTRAAGGYVVAAGSRLRVAGLVRHYRIARDTPVRRLPQPLAARLAREPTLDRAPVMPRFADDPDTSTRLAAYVAAAVAGEAEAVANAKQGTRNHTLFRAAANLGELIAGGLLDEALGRQALLAAAEKHVGTAGFTRAEADRTVANGLHAGQCNPRRPVA